MGKQAAGPPKGSPQAISSIPQVNEDKQESNKESGEDNPMVKVLQDAMKKSKENDKK